MRLEFRTLYAVVTTVINFRSRMSRSRASDIFVHVDNQSRRVQKLLSRITVSRRLTAQKVAQAKRHLSTVVQNADQRELLECIFSSVNDVV